MDSKAICMRSLFAYYCMKCMRKHKETESNGARVPANKMLPPSPISVRSYSAAAYILMFFKQSHEHTPTL